MIKRLPIPSPLRWAILVAPLVGAACATSSSPYICPYDVPEEERTSANLPLSEYAVAPDILNSSQVVQALVNAYPEDLRDNRCEGSTVVWFDIDADGDTRRVRVQTSSGMSELDEAALKVARIMEFSPARDAAGAAIPAQVAFPVRFRAF